jgi:hypothetical protein
MTHLEELLAEYYEWLGYVVKCNARVGPLARGGWEMELDIVAYDPKSGTVLHLEPSLDAQSWATRAVRFEKKFAAGRKYILRDLFPWLPPTTPIIQRAIFFSTSANHRELAGAAVMTIDEVVAEIKQAVLTKGVASHAAISEHYPLLRTLQFAVCGYCKLVEPEAQQSRFTDMPQMTSMVARFDDEYYAGHRDATAGRSRNPTGTSQYHRGFDDGRAQRERNGKRV